MNKRQIDSFVKKIDVHMKSIAKERDKLDETLGSITSLIDDCDRATESLLDAKRALEDARDELSKQV